MGDYFDPYSNVGHEDLWNNFEKIVNLKLNNPDKVTLLFGNHDHHYTKWCTAVGSRLDPVFNATYGIGGTVQGLIENGTLQLAYAVPKTDIVCIHAGISQAWYNIYLLKRSYEQFLTEPVVSVEPDGVEDLAKKMIEYGKGQTQSLGFNTDTRDYYGYDPQQGPLWWRCLNDYIYGDYGLQEKDMLQGITQVMGHTQVKNLVKIKGKNVTGVFVDGLGSNWYTELEVSETGYEFKQVKLK